MDGYSARGNTIFCTFATVMGTCAVLNHLSTWLPMERFDVKPVANININKVHDLTLNTYLNMEQSILSFNLTHDLSSEFHWNMNQLFLYVVATYNDTSSNRRNEVTIWDRIVRSTEDANFKKKAVMVEYPLRDQFRELRSQKVHLHLRYRTMPIVGIMYEKEVASSSFQIPGEYFRDGMQAQLEEAKKKEQQKAKKLGWEDWQYR
eukprot:TRINITY_DN45165_c0_g1_i1.p1 TRINITY_DN45165_c0_g1~~TRINITY_DN45165_c0_g1_i1.p1  ORF type:complete len:205 (+),score=43.45 TRINITY_DN45165_c0_g1_i1:137-751(+)